MHECNRALKEPPARTSLSEQLGIFSISAVNNISLGICLKISSFLFIFCALIVIFILLISIFYFWHRHRRARRCFGVGRVPRRRFAYLALIRPAPAGPTVPQHLIHFLLAPFFPARLVALSPGDFRLCMLFKPFDFLYLQTQISAR